MEEQLQGGQVTGADWFNHRHMEGGVDFESVWEFQMHSRGVNDMINCEWTNESGR